METLNLSAFVADTITEIAIGVEKAKENLKEYDVLINPATDTSGHVRTNNEGVVRKTQEIVFDLSVSISKEEIDIEKDSKEGNARIQVVSLFNFSLGGNIKNESVDELNLKNTAINKIRFSIPVSFGTNKPGTTKGFSITSSRI
ncbi:hypothetical protein [Chryseobacterium sp. WX]|uniref:hypothetical protein n=1 Tax=Chryseobacterium sp. WX TaxID=3031803 RepID=UPI002409561B|nr:hypothetical protein [Chryseobacterium sp. WX]WFB67025.1 hypothetical protein PZ898_20275 [Chryseobacterium sp. WX]